MYDGFDSLLKNEKKQVFAKEKNKTEPMFV